MLKTKLNLIFIFIALFTLGCSSNSSKTNTNTDIHPQLQENINKVKKEVDALFVRAEASRKKAASVGGEWRDISKFIKQAKRYQKEGRCEKAIKTLLKAIKQGEMGYQQMIKQKDSYMPGYFKF